MHALADAVARVLAAMLQQPEVEQQLRLSHMLDMWGPGHCASLEFVDQSLTLDGENAAASSTLMTFLWQLMRPSASA